MGLFSKKSSDDEADWMTECRNCGGLAVNSSFCSEACGVAHWEAQERSNSGAHNTNPNCPACGGAGSCKMCEDTGW